MGWAHHQPARQVGSSFGVVAARQSQAQRKGEKRPYHQLDAAAHTIVEEVDDPSVSRMAGDFEQRHQQVQGAGSGAGGTPGRAWLARGSRA